SKGVVEAVVVPWEITTSIKVDELAKHHTEFDARIGGLYTVAFVVAMNKAKYNSLPPDLKAIIDKHSGIDASGALGRDHQAGDPLGRKAAVDRKNNIVTIGGAELEGFRKAADLVDDDWVKEVTGKGLNGQGLLTCAKDLIKKHTR
ncbi:MAG: C4-dicarboxylate ABC transporter, partial [Burkholderiales bacterium]